MDVRATIARFRLGLLGGERLPDLAVAMLEEGFDSQALREVAGLERPTLRDAAHLFERALVETQIELGEREALQLVVIDSLRRTANGEVPPLTGAGELADFWIHRDLPNDFGAFLSLVEDWHEHPEVRADVEKEIVDTAAALLAQYPGPTA